jgi:WD40 repeat protein
MAAASFADGAIRFWEIPRFAHDEDLKTDELKITPSFSLEGVHTERVAKIACHPTGDYLLASSGDKTWSLWDLETQSVLLKQTGHGAGVFGIAVHSDGSIVVTGDVQGQCKVWDLRTGNKILELKGHSSGVLPLDVLEMDFMWHQHQKTNFKTA